MSEASLQEVSGWFPGVGVNGVRRRFRSNLEIAGVPPFWEDRLFGLAEQPEPFRIGPVAFFGHNPCQRCVVPTRDPDGGEPLPGFQKVFMERRKGHLPPWAESSRFNHFYRFATNTSIPLSEGGKVLRVGDPVSVPPGKVA